MTLHVENHGGDVTPPPQSENNNENSNDNNNNASDDLEPAAVRPKTEAEPEYAAESETQVSSLIAIHYFRSLSLARVYVSVIVVHAMLFDVHAMLFDAGCRAY